MVLPFANLNSCERALKTLFSLLPAAAEMGNVLGFVRMVRQAGLRHCSAALCIAGGRRAAPDALRILDSLDSREEACHPAGPAVPVPGSVCLPCTASQNHLQEARVDGSASLIWQDTRRWQAVTRRTSSLGRSDVGPSLCCSPRRMSQRMGMQPGLRELAARAATPTSTTTMTVLSAPLRR